MGKIFRILALIIAVAGWVSATPRCGSDDIALERQKRYVLNNRPHLSKTISYRISDYSKQLTKEQVDNVLARAFKMWADHTDLKFIKKQPNEQADIDIRFASGDHGDGYPFDGPGMTLAHALRQYVHFDEDETWKATPDGEGASLFKVATHEIGHSLGLEHSPIVNSVMFFAHLGDDEHEFKLHDDDISGIQEIYGVKTTNARSIISTSDLCTDPTFDTMFESSDGKMYILKKDNYYEIEGTIVKEGPKPISEKWVGLPGDINGAFTKDGKTYFFKDDQYWSFTDDKMDSDSPSKLDSKIPSTIDDVTVWEDDKIYFFKGNKFYRVDDFVTNPADVYSSSIADEFKEIPDDNDAVHYSKTWGLTFFFKKDKFWAYELKGDEPYVIPSIPTTSYFFGCRYQE